MEHKAYAFNWPEYEAQLRPHLHAALAKNDPTPLATWIGTNLAELTDPYEGGQLEEDWEGQLSSRDVDEYGDFALTKFYNLLEDWGLGDGWIDIVDRYPEVREATLGSPETSGSRTFDPGKMGSYFITPANTQAAMELLTVIDDKDLQEFREFLSHCAKGAYVTF